MAVSAWAAESGSTLRKLQGGDTGTAPGTPPARTSGSPATPTRASGLGYSLTFYDDFSTLDTTVWRRNGTGSSFDGADGGTNDGSNAEMQWYHPDQVTVSDGMLHLKAEKTPYTATRLTYAGDSRFSHLTSSGGHPVYPYRSGAVCSKPDVANGVTGATFGPGCFVEAEVNVPSARGSWTAFWMMPHPAQFWPAGGEVDWFEQVGKKPWDGNPGLTEQENQTCNLHYSDIGGGVTTGPYGFRRADGSDAWPGIPLTSGWHRIGGLRLTDRVEFWMDGVKWHEILGSNKAPQTDMFLILNLAIGGQYPGDPNAAGDQQMPYEMRVNYVAVWS